MKEYLTINEYAAVKGMTRQAVYKKIRSGKIAAEERTIDGMRKKVIVLDPDQIDVTPRDQDAGRDGRQPPKVETADSNEIRALEKAIETLTQQLAEKDRQISSLMQLLHDQQELQAHSQLLLSQPAPEEKPIQEEPTVSERTDVPEEKPKRRGFWAWWFS